MRDHQSVRDRVLALLLSLCLVGQLGATAWASSEPGEGMLSAGEVSSAQAAQEEQSAQPQAEASAEASAQGSDPAESDDGSSARDQEAMSAQAEAETRAPEDGEQAQAPEADEAEFWEEFHEEYAEDGDYLKRYELYHEQGVKRSFENDDDIPGTVEVLSDEELEALSSGGTTKSPFTNKTYTHAEVHKGKRVVLGIDISKWQSSVDWSKVKAAGVKFVFLRCGYTKVHSWDISKDEKFDKYVKEAYDAGLQVGIYYFSQATTESEAVAEAAKTLEYISPYASMITLPVVMDIETGKMSGKAYRINKVTRAQGTKNVLAYCKTIEDAGYDAYYYGNPNDLATMCDVSQLGAYGCWLARYATSTTYSGSYDFWQYASNGKVSGISGGVDCNFWYVGESTPTNYNGKPGLVTGLSVTETKHTSIGLKWDAVTNAQSYIVEGMKEGESTYSALTTSVGNTCKVSGLSAKTVYYLRVKGVNTKGTGSPSGAISVTTADGPVNRTDLPAPVLLSVACVNGGVEVKWQATDDADLYRLLRKSEGSDWTAVLDTDQLAAVDTTAVSGTTYTYSVRCINVSDRSDAGSMDETGKSITYYAAPVLKSASYTKKGVKVKWTKSSGVKKYAVLRKEGTGKWKKLKVTSSSSYTDTKAKAGKAYCYTVRCVSEDGKSYLSGYDAQGLGVCTLSAPRLRKVKNNKKGTLTAKWSKVKGAEGYQMRCVLDGAERTKSVSGVGKTSAAVKGLTKKKTYVVSVRAWKKAGNTVVYTAWSSTKTAKVSK